MISRLWVSSYLYYFFLLSKTDASILLYFSMLFKNILCDTMFLSIMISIDKPLLVSLLFLPSYTDVTILTNFKYFINISNSVSNIHNQVQYVCQASITPRNISEILKITHGKYHILSDWCKYFWTSENIANLPFVSNLPFLSQIN